MGNPIYGQDEIVYLIESAKAGFIESYKVKEIRQDASGQWLYKILIAARPPNKGATYGDRVTLRHGYDFELRESELTTYCEALSLAIINVSRNLAYLQSLYASQCEESNAD